eukprot:scaffold58745_cov66-Phaeocystis_antarctica.AAC.8
MRPPDVPNRTSELERCPRDFLKCSWRFITHCDIDCEMLGAWAALRLLNDIGTLLFNTHFIVRTGSGAAESKVGKGARTRVGNAWQQLTRSDSATVAPAANQLPHAALLALLLLTPLAAACGAADHLGLRGGGGMLLLVVDRPGSANLIAAGQQLRRRGMRLRVSCASDSVVDCTRTNALDAGVQVSVIRSSLLRGGGRRALLLGPAPRRRLRGVLASRENRLQRGASRAPSGSADPDSLLQLVEAAEGDVRRWKAQ